MSEFEINIESDDLVNKFAEYLITTLNSEDNLHRIVIGQLHLESCLDALLENLALLPSKMQLEKTNYFNKVKLCVAFGLVHSEFESSLDKIGSLRNKYAHNLEIDDVEKHERDLLNVIKQTSLRDKIVKEKIQFDSDFSKCIWALWLYLFEQFMILTKCRQGIISKIEELTGTSSENESSIAPNSFQIIAKKLIKEQK